MNWSCGAWGAGNDGVHNRPVNSMLENKNYGKENVSGKESQEYGRDGTYSIKQGDQGRLNWELRLEQGPGGGKWPRWKK